MKRFLRILIIIILFVILFIFLNILVKPKYKEDLIEGSLISDYYESNFDHEVIILGDCEAYANFSPMELYEHFGIKSFIRGSSQQMLWQSYYILKETLNYETPKLVVLNVGALRNGEDKINEAYNRLAIDNMRISKEKINIIDASMSDEESMLSYFLPILRYHDRISSLTKEDIKYFKTNKTVSYNGFIMNKEIKATENLPIKKKLASYDFDKRNLEYLDKIVKLCQEKNIDLLLVKAPSLYPYWYSEHDDYVKKYAKENNINYLNLLDYQEEIGLDFKEDTYDGGLHLNLAGAVKNSIFFGEYLKEQYNLTDYKNDAKYDELLNIYKEAKKR